MPVWSSFTLTMKGQCTDWTATHTTLILGKTLTKWHYGNEDEIGFCSSKWAYNNFLLKPLNSGHNVSVKFHNWCKPDRDTSHHSSSKIITRYNFPDANNRTSQQSMVFRSLGQLKLQTMTHWHLEVSQWICYLYIWLQNYTVFHLQCFLFPQKNKLRKLLQTISWAIIAPD